MFWCSLIKPHLHVVSYSPHDSKPCAAYFNQVRKHIVIHSPFQYSDVVAFVEVRTGAENRSKAIISKLKQLGAVVVDKLSDEVTHVIWKDGKRNTLQRAKKRNIPVVTVLWVER